MITQRRLGAAGAVSFDGEIPSPDAVISSPTWTQEEISIQHIGVMKRVLKIHCYWFL